MHASLVIVALSLSVVAPSAVFAQAPGAASKPAAAAAAPATPRITRPPLFLKEEWKQIAGGGEHPVTSASVTAANVEMNFTALRAPKFS